MGEQEGGVKAWACMTFDFTGSQKSSVYTGATEKTYMCIDKWDFRVLWCCVNEKNKRRRVWKSCMSSEAPSAAVNLKHKSKHMVHLNTNTETH